MPDTDVPDTAADAEAKGWTPSPPGDVPKLKLSPRFGAPGVDCNEPQNDGRRCGAIYPDEQGRRVAAYCRDGLCDDFRIEPP